MIRDLDFYVFQGAEKSHSCIICLAGRAGCGGRLAHHYQEAAELSNTTFVGVTPWSGKQVEWYPQPYSAEEQREAVAGLETARFFVERIIESVSKEFNIPRKRIALTGFSAGAVMSLYAVTRSDKDLAGAVVHAGACLEPNKIPQRKNDTDILLTHGKEDYCFDWYERYVPMKNALLKKGWSTFAFEDPKETHRVSYNDMITSSQFLAPRLGYENFQHSHAENPKPLRMQAARKEKIPRNWKEIAERRFKHWR